MQTKNDSGIAHRALSSIAAVSCCLAVAISLAAAQPAPPAASFSLAPGSRLSLEGQSTLHAYSSTATKVEATAEFDGTFAASSADARAAVAAGALKSLRVAVPVAGLKSGEGGLDKNMQKALKQDTAPVIRFTLVDYKAEEAKDGSLLVKAHGRLSIAGIEKETVVEASCRFGPGGGARGAAPPHRLRRRLQGQLRALRGVVDPAGHSRRQGSDLSPDSQGRAHRAGGAEPLPEHGERAARAGPRRDRPQGGGPPRLLRSPLIPPNGSRFAAVTGGAQASAGSGAQAPAATGASTIAVP
ncbi:MAG TPA: YceI family protein [Thermoanaerobaculia bacterium]|nr:YceI family protein [Thermoanaerobaculia bacterium]